ncbi:MAG: hypothetical protein VX899_18730 [Myxococcota bacterium]|nr:hypothetical protein [Myxococcota bacterium]
MSIQELLLLLLAGLFGLAALMWWRASTRGSRRSRARNGRALSGEEEAEDLLEQEGFTVLERQLRGSWELVVDGEVIEVGVRADLLVERDGLRYIAEVKTGDLAPDVGYAPTRRQLLEYWFVFEPDGLLLIDMEAGLVQHVAFFTEGHALEAARAPP